MKLKKNHKNLLIINIAFIILLVLHELFSIFFTVDVINEGISFGLINSNILNILLIFTLITLLIYSYKNKNVFLLFVFIAAMVNFIDRIRFGGVRDYWKIPFIDLFNNINDYIIFLSLIFYTKDNIWKRK